MNSSSISARVSQATRVLGRSSVALVAAAAAGVLLPGSTHTFAQAPPAGSGPITISGFVRVIEGDTLEVSINGRRVGVGVVGIKALRGNSPCGKQSISLAYQLLPGRLTLQEDPLVSAFDARKRRMYRVLMPNGRPLAVELARAGLAHRKGEGIDDEDITAAEDDAKKSGKPCSDEQ